MQSGGPKNTHGDPPSDPEALGGGIPQKRPDEDSDYTHDLALLPPSVSPIPASSRSTLQARANEEMEWARQNRLEVFEAYARLEESVDGRIINGDLFVTLLPSVDANPDQVHTLDLTDMNYLAVDLYELSVRKSREEANTVIVLVGVPGAGKSTLARDLVAKRKEIHTVMDSNGANWDALCAAVNYATRHGRSVAVLYVGGSIEIATSRTISRFITDKRVVPASVQANLHRSAPTNFLKALQDLRDEAVGFDGFDANSQNFVQDPGSLAQADLNHPNNNANGITNLLKEAIHDQGLDPESTRAFTQSEEV